MVSTYPTGLKRHDDISRLGKRGFAGIDEHATSECDRINFTRVSLEGANQIQVGATFGSRLLLILAPETIRRYGWWITNGVGKTDPDYVHQKSHLAYVNFHSRTQPECRAAVFMVST